MLSWYHFLTQTAASLGEEHVSLAVHESSAEEACFFYANQESSDIILIHKSIPCLKIVNVKHVEISLC